MLKYQFFKYFWVKYINCTYFFIFVLWPLKDLKLYVSFVLYFYRTALISTVVSYALLEYVNHLRKLPYPYSEKSLSLYTNTWFYSLVVICSMNVLWNFWICFGRWMSFFPQQWHAYNPALQLPYYEMTALLPNSTSVSSSLNHVPDLEAGPSSYEWTHQQPNDPDLYQMNKQKRKKQTSDSDSSTENNRGSEYSQKFRKCKKKKRY